MNLWVSKCKKQQREDKKNKAKKTKNKKATNEIYI